MEYWTPPGPQTSVKVVDGQVTSVHRMLATAFDAGYEAGAEDAGSGELLAKAEALQMAFYDRRQDKAGCCAGRVGDGRSGGDD